LRLLLINPNTSSHITGRLADSARAAMRPGDTLTAVTASNGPDVVRCADHLREAEASAMALADEHAANHDAIVLGISLDGITTRLREHYPTRPVIGMTEAALVTACLRAERIGLLTLGASLLPLYRQRVQQVGMATRVASYEPPDLPVAFKVRTEREAPAVLEVLVAAGHRLRQSMAQVIVLAGAVLCEYSASLAARLSLPVFGGMTHAVEQVYVLLAQGSWPTGQ